MIVKRFSLTLLALLISLIVLLIILIDRTPIISTKPLDQLNDAETVSLLFKELKQSISSRYERNAVTVNKQQIDSITGFLQRAVPNLRADSRLSTDCAFFLISLELPSPFNRFYLNTTVKVLPGNGVNIEYIKAGGFSFSGRYAVKSAIWMVNYFTDSEVATIAYNQVSKVELFTDHVNLMIEPLDPLLSALNTLNTGLSIEENDELKQYTAYYLAFLANSNLATFPERQSISKYIQLLMSEAARISQPSSAVYHNEGLFMALAIYVGHHRVANLVGDVQPNPKKYAKPLSHTTLKFRHDLARHFAISAALEVVSEQNMPLAIGEFKELLDRASGGSGYSFVDLAADVSGIAFAEQLLNPERAYYLQHQLAKGVEEHEIIPNVYDLPEGLTKSEFEERYSSVHSEAYQSQVNEVISRVKALPLYKTQ